MAQIAVYPIVNILGLTLLFTVPPIELISLLVKSIVQISYAYINAALFGKPGSSVNPIIKGIKSEFNRIMGEVKFGFAISASLFKELIINSVKQLFNDTVKPLFQFVAILLTTMVALVAYAGNKAFVGDTTVNVSDVAESPDSLKVEPRISVDPIGSSHKHGDGLDHHHSPVEKTRVDFPITSSGPGSSSRALVVDEEDSDSPPRPSSD